MIFARCCKTMLYKYELVSVGAEVERGGEETVVGESESGWKRVVLMLVCSVVLS